MQTFYDFLLKQGIGSASQPIIAVGERVRRGQLIATYPDGSLGQNLHTSVSGTVYAADENKITIEADKEQTNDFIPLQGNEPLALIKEAGIIGLGGAGFPTQVKLSKKFESGGTIIVNAAECEPILDHNMSLINEHPEEIIKGLKIVMNIVNAQDSIFGIKKIHTAEIEKLRSKIDTDIIRIHELENIYPMGEERALVREITGILLPVDKLPLEAGAIIVNVETVYRIYEAVELKKPLIDKDLTVGGKLNGALIKVFRDIPLGTTVEEMIERAGGISSHYGEIIMGGPFTGKRTELNAPIVKTTGGIIVTEEFWKGPEKIGLLVCACGGNEERLREIALSMGSQVAGVEFCKQAQKMKNGALKCENPGICPGQVQKIMNLKKNGAQAVLISNCTDCSNTVMSCAPPLKLPVYHCTDGALRAVNFKLVRKIK